MSFSSTRCATEGFRLIRREPWTLLAWCLAYVVLNLTALMVVRPYYSIILARLQQGPGAPGRGWDMLQAYAIFIPLTLLPLAVFSCAVYRAVLEPSPGRAGRLRLGPDEARVALLWLLIGLIFAAAWLGVLMLIGLGASWVAIGATAFAPLTAAALLAVSLGLVVLSVRLSLAGPMTLADRRLRLLASWRLTRGLFWKVAGCNALAAAFGAGLWLMAALLQAALLAGSGEPLSYVIGRWWQADSEIYLRPLAWESFASVAVSSVFAALWFAVVFAPGAAVYRALAAGLPRSEAEVFE